MNEFQFSDLIKEDYEKLPIGMAIYQEVFGIEEVHKLRVACFPLR